MEQNRSEPTEFPTFVVALLLLVLPVAFYWRQDLFFMWDDWTELDLMAHNPFWKYLIMPDGEIFFPFFHLIFYGLIKLSGEHYGILVLVNCLGISLVSFLLYLFLKYHLNHKASLLISLVYAGGTIQQAIVWNAFYLSYILSLFFFILALLLTERYLRSTSYNLLPAIGLCCFFSIHSHNYTVLAVVALPVYAVLTRDTKETKKSLALGGVVTIVIFSFIWEYLMLVGFNGLTFYNRGIFSGFPGPTFFPHWFAGSLLSPLSFLFLGHNQSILLVFIFGLLIFSGIMAVILLFGGPRERRLAIFAVLINALPFMSVSLVRHQISISQALMVRYIFFSMVGVMFLAGIALKLISVRLTKNIWVRLLPIALITIMISGQLLGLPIWQRGYLQLSRKALDNYQEPGLFSKETHLWLTPHHPIQQCQLEDIRRFLKGHGPGDVERLSRGEP
jgi:hypothetical protein